MERIPEPELMDGVDQAAAYAAADFAAPHQAIVARLDAVFPGFATEGPILDLGCGPGDITFRLARRFPRARLVGVDGAAAMLRLAEERRRGEANGTRVRFVQAMLPDGAIPELPYTLIASNSLLHHLHRPTVLWDTVRRHAAPGARIFIVDLMRPESREEAARMVERYSGNEPDVLKQDFFHSLLAAFSPDEVKDQIAAACLAGLAVEAISDRHLMVWGRR